MDPFNIKASLRALAASKRQEPSSYQPPQEEPRDPVQKLGSRIQKDIVKEAPPGLLERAGGTALSGLATVGNLLDVPGSMVRDVATWLPGGPKPANPLDQVVSPFTHHNRTTGRDLLRGYGLAGKEDTMGNFTTGIGAEIALDPLTYLTFGAAALTRGGRAAKALNMMDDAPEIASRLLNRKVGKREARHTVTPRMLLDNPRIPYEARQRLQQRMTEMGVTEKDMDRQLGGLAKINMPFSNKPFKFGGKPVTFWGLTDEEGIIGAGKARGRGPDPITPVRDIPPPDDLGPSGGSALGGDGPDIPPTEGPAPDITDMPDSPVPPVAPMTPEVPPLAGPAASAPVVEPPPVSPSAAINAISDIQQIDASNYGVSASIPDSQSRARATLTYASESDETPMLFIDQFEKQPGSPNGSGRALINSMVDKVKDRNPMGVAGNFDSYDQLGAFASVFGKDKIRFLDRTTGQPVDIPFAEANAFPKKYTAVHYFIEPPKAAKVKPEVPQYKPEEIEAGWQLGYKIEDIPRSYNEMAADIKSNPVRLLAAESAANNLVDMVSKEGTPLLEALDDLESHVDFRFDGLRLGKPSPAEIEYARGVLSIIDRPLDINDLIEHGKAKVADARKGEAQAEAERIFKKFGRFDLDESLYYRAVLGEAPKPKQQKSLIDDAGEAGQTFKTERGSEYKVLPDGTTQRNKAKRWEHGNDSGIKEPSAKTIYVDDDGRGLSGAGLQGVDDFRVVFEPDGTVSAVYPNDAGQWGYSDTKKIKFYNEPAIGRHPLELWKREDLNGMEAYRSQHIGNKIIEIGGQKPAGKMPPSKVDVVDDAGFLKQPEDIPATGIRAEVRNGSTGKRYAVEIIQDSPQRSLAKRLDDDSYVITRNHLNPDGSVVFRWVDIEFDKSDLGYAREVYAGQANQASTVSDIPPSALQPDLMTPEVVKEAKKRGRKPKNVPEGQKVAEAEDRAKSAQFVAEQNQQRMLEQKKQEQQGRINNWKRAYQSQPKEYLAASDLGRKDYEKALTAISPMRLMEMVDDGVVRGAFTAQEAADLKLPIANAARADVLKKFVDSIDPGKTPAQTERIAIESYSSLTDEEKMLFGGSRDFGVQVNRYAGEARRNRVPASATQPDLVTPEVVQEAKKRGRKPKVSPATEIDKGAKGTYLTLEDGTEVQITGFKLDQATLSGYYYVRYPDNLLSGDWHTITEGAVYNAKPSKKYANAQPKPVAKTETPVATPTPTQPMTSMEAMQAEAGIKSATPPSDIARKTQALVKEVANKRGAGDAEVAEMLLRGDTASAIRRLETKPLDGLKLEGLMSAAKMNGIMTAEQADAVLAAIPPKFKGGMSVLDEAKQVSNDLASKSRLESRIDQTETPEFKNWFRASKVVDDAGKPMVVYHGTQAEFSQFDNPYAEDLGGNFHMFSDNPEYADNFANGKQGQLKPSFLSIQNPLDLTGLPRRRGDVRNKLKVALVQSGITDEDLLRLIPYERDLFQFINNGEIKEGKSFRQRLVEEAKKSGYDGIKLPDAFHNIEKGEVEGTTFIAFSPEQIKSATANRGTFDPASRSILESQQQRVGIRVDTETEGLGKQAELLAAKGFTKEEIDVIDAAYRNMVSDADYSSDLSGTITLTTVPKDRLIQTQEWRNKPAIKGSKHPLLAIEQDGELYLKDGHHRLDGVDGNVPVVYYKTAGDFENEGVIQVVRENQSRLEAQGGTPGAAGQSPTKVDLNTLEGLPEQARPIVGDMISKIGQKLFDDVTMEVGGDAAKAVTTGDIDMDTGFIRIYNSAIQSGIVDKTTVHELWHHLSKFITAEEVRIVQKEFDDAVKANKGPLPYELSSIDEYFAHKLTDLSMKYLGKEKPASLIGKTWAKALDVFEYLWDAIRQTLGYDKTKQILNSFLDGHRAGAVKLTDATMQQRLAGDVEINGNILDTQQKITDTPAFQKWFGESKILDDSGAPKVMYHGTHREFTEFDRLHATKLYRYIPKDSIDTIGIWFTDRADTAKNLYGPRAVDAYISSQKPFVIHGENAFEKMETLAKRLGGNHKMREWMVGNGYDSIWLKGVKLDGATQDALIAFEPTQIKSATANRGTFDRNSKNILESQADPVIPNSDIAGQLAQAKSAILGKSLDDIGESILDSAVGRQMTALFDQSVLGQITKAGIEAARLAFKGYRDAVFQERAYMAQHLRTWYDLPNIREDIIMDEELGSLDDFITAAGGDKALGAKNRMIEARKIQGGRVNDLRRLLEQPLWDEQGNWIQDAFRVEDHELPAWVGQEKVNGQITNNPARRQQVAQMLSAWRLKTVQMLGGERNEGILIALVNGYFPRLVSNLPGSNRSLWNPNYGKILDPTHPNAKRRKDWFVGYDDGTSVINDISIDAELSGAHAKKMVREQLSPAEIQQYANVLWERYKDRLLGGRSQLTYGELAQADPKAFAKINKLTEEVMNLDPRHAEHQIPLFSNDLFSAMELRLEHHHRSIMHAKAIQHLVKKNAVARNLIGGDGRGVTLNQLLKEARYDSKGARKILEIGTRGEVALTADKNFWNQEIQPRINEAVRSYQERRAFFLRNPGAPPGAATGITPYTDPSGRVVQMDPSTPGMVRLTFPQFFDKKVPDVPNHQMTIEVDLRNPSESVVTWVDQVDDGVNYIGDSAPQILINPTNITSSSGYTTGNPLYVLLDHVTVPQDVGEAITKFVQGPRTLEEVKPIVRGYDKLTNMWKMMQTGMMPFVGFHGRNFGSGQASNFYLGIQNDPRFKFNIKDPTTYLNPIRAFVQPIIDAHKIATGQTVNGAAGMPQFVGMNLTDEAATEALRREMYAQGITGEKQGLSAEQLTDTVGTAASQFPGIDRAKSINPLAWQWSKPAEDSTFAQRWLMPWMSKGVMSDADVFRPGQLGRDLGGYTEALNRLAPYLAMRRQGFDPKAAAREVNRAQVDYTNLSNFNREYTRRLFPFASYTLGMTPTVFGELASRPGGGMGRTVMATTSAGQSSEQGVTPDYIRETASIPLGMSEDGTRSYITGFGLPFEDPLQFAQLARGNVSGVLRELGSRMNPVPKSLIEIMTGRSLYQAGPFGGREIEDLDPTIGRILANINDLATGEKTEKAEPFLGNPWAEYLIANAGPGRMLNTARTITDPRKWDTIPWKLALNLGTGVRVADVSPSAQDAILRERLARVMKDFGGRMYSRPYFPDYAKEDWTAQESEDAAKIDALLKLLGQRAKERRV